MAVKPALVGGAMAKPTCIVTMFSCKALTPLVVMLLGSC